MLKQFPWQILRCYSSTFTLKTCTFSQTQKQWGEMKNRKSSSDSSINEQQERVVSSSPEWTGCLVICVSLLTIDGIASFFFKKKKKRYSGLEKIWSRVVQCYWALISVWLEPIWCRMKRSLHIKTQLADSLSLCLQTRQSTSYICTIHYFPFIWLFISLSPSLWPILYNVSAQRGRKKRNLLSSITPLARTRA